MVWFDRILSILIILAGVVHAFDSLKYYDDPVVLVWALCGSLFLFLFGAISLLRASRPGDRALSWICLASGLAWIVVALRFAHVTGRMVDTHVLIVVIVTLGMCAFSARSLMTRKS